ncbi:unnamed protein product, partial [Laminaria digitata]
MSFILNYLDEALDTVTGRYDEHNEENGSEGGSAVGGTNEDEGEGAHKHSEVPPATPHQEQQQQADDAQQEVPPPQSTAEVASDAASSNPSAAAQRSFVRREDGPEQRSELEA